MTKQQQTYILSDAECIIKAMVDHPGPWSNDQKCLWPEYLNKIDQAKSTAVRFADQGQAKAVLWMNDKTEDLSFADFSSLIKPNTIYTVEGYEVGTFKDHDALCFFDNPPCECQELATLKRIEPVVEQVTFTDIYKEYWSYRSVFDGEVEQLAEFPEWLDRHYLPLRKH